MMDDRNDDWCDALAPDRGDGPVVAGARKDAPKRLPNGRFGHEHSGNPAGRPPAREPSVTEGLKRILAGKTSSNNPAFANLNLLEGMLLSMCVQGLKDYRAARAVIAMLEPERGTEVAGEAYDGPDGDAVLNRFVERELRRRGVQGGAPGDEGEDGNGAP